MIYGESKGGKIMDYFLVISSFTLFLLAMITVFIK